MVGEKLAALVGDQRSFAETYAKDARHAQYAMQVECHAGLEHVFASFGDLHGALDPRRGKPIPTAQPKQPRIFTSGSTSRSASIECACHIPIARVPPLRFEKR